MIENGPCSQWDDVSPSQCPGYRENRSKHDLLCNLRVEQLSTGRMKSWDERERERERERPISPDNNVEQEEVFVDNSRLASPIIIRLYLWLIRFPGRYLSSPNTSSHHKAKHPGDLEFHPWLFLSSSFILQCTSARPPRLNWNKKPLYAAPDFVSVRTVAAWLSQTCPVPAIW